MPPGGAETQVLLLSKALVRRGLRVAIVAFGRDQELPSVVDGISIIPRRPFSRRRLIGKFIETARIWRTLWLAPSSTIVFRGMGLQLAVLALYARVSGRRLVYSAANVVDFDCRRLLTKRRDAFMYEIGARLADEIVVQTEEQIGLCEATFRRPPVLIKSIEPLGDPAPQDPEAFLWVGRLVEYKRPLDYVALAKAVPEARFWMVGVPGLEPGDQPIHEAVSSAAATLPNLELLAPRANADVRGLMRRAVASVNTAEFEGMPNVLLEAWTEGVPALILNHDPGKVVENHGLGGFADGSPERLAELARAQWQTRLDPEERRAVADRCRAYIRRCHAPDVIVEEWARVLVRPSRSTVDGPSVVAVEAECAE